MSGKLMMQILILTLASGAMASGAKKAPKAQPSASSKGVGTEFRFNPFDIKGKYQSAGELNAKAENEKALQDLLAMRSDFKDRVRADMERK